MRIRALILSGYRQSGWKSTPKAADENKELADALYVWNARASAALFEPIHHFEVLLRNTIVRTLGTAPSQKNGIPGTLWIQQSSQVFDVVNRLKRDSKPVTPGHVYVFQAGRSFQNVDYVAFYADQQIKPCVPAFLQKISGMR